MLLRKPITKTKQVDMINDRIQDLFANVSHADADIKEQNRPVEGVYST